MTGRRIQSGGFLRRERARLRLRQLNIEREGLIREFPDLVRTHPGPDRFTNRVTPGYSGGFARRWRPRI